MAYRGTKHRDMTEQDEKFFKKMLEILNCETCDNAPKSMDALLPHVFIGNMDNAESLALLRRNRITHVLNCAGFKGKRSYEGSPYEGHNIEYKEFLADDHEMYDITQHFQEAFRYLNKVKALRGCALVHCVQGVNRSAAICVAYIMEERNMKLLQALRLIKRRRNVALCNRGFLRQLLQFARKNNSLENIKEAALENKRSQRKSSLSTLPLSFENNCYISPYSKKVQDNEAPQKRGSERRHSVGIKSTYPVQSNNLSPLKIQNLSDDMFEVYINRRMLSVFRK